jgi:hypothetical protein
VWQWFCNVGGLWGERRRSWGEGVRRCQAMATCGAEACAQCLGRHARRARCVGVCVVRFVPGRVGARQPRSLSQVQGFALSEASLG